MTPVTREQLEQVAKARLTFSDAPAKGTASPEFEAAIRSLRQRGITLSEQESDKNSLKYHLSECLFIPAHQGGTSVSIIEYASGAKTYSCFHSDCNGQRKWRDVMHALALDGKPKANAGQPSKIAISNLPDVRKIAAREVNFLVPGLIVKNTLTLISGEASAGKTTLAFWLANAIATGAEVLGGICKKHPVLYLTRENPLDYVGDIVTRLRIENGEGSNLLIWGDWIDELAPAPAAAHVLAWVSQCDPGAFVVVDSLSAFFEGNDENDAGKMRDFINQGRDLLRAGAVGVLYLHHPGKAESAKVYRGSSDLKPAIDTGYLLSNSGDGVLERLHLKHFKVRFLRQKHELLLNYRDDNFVPDERPTAVYESNKEILTRLLRENPGIGMTAFEEAAQEKGVTQSRARQFLESGVLLGTVRRERGHHNRFCHSLVEPDKTTVQ